MITYSQDEPIAALATPWGTAALAVIRVSGEKSFELLSPYFSGDLNKYRTHSLHYGTLHEGTERIDDLVLGIYRAPQSYTGEDMVEIFCHGGPAIIQRILNLLFSAGFRQAQPGEFTLRAFLNNRIDLPRAEAVDEIIKAKTNRARGLALNRLSGAVGQKIETLKQGIIDLRAQLEVAIDYPDEPEGKPLAAADVSLLIAEFKKLSGTYQTGKNFQEGVICVIGGRTNAGKSTLFNLLLREDRAIVSEVHGTTRDFIEGQISLDGVPIRLFDTAGIRESQDNLESAGIKRSLKLIKNADLILYLIDTSAGLSNADRQSIEQYAAHSQVLVIWNKADLLPQAKIPTTHLRISAVTAEGLAALHQAISSAILKTTTLPQDEVVIDSLRQKAALERATAALENLLHSLEQNLPLDLLGVDIQEAQDAVGELTGEITSADVLNRIFSRFCVGK